MLLEVLGGLLEANDLYSLFETSIFSMFSCFTTGGEGLREVS